MAAVVGLHQTELRVLSWLELAPRTGEWLEVVWDRGTVFLDLCQVRPHVSVGKLMIPAKAVMSWILCYQSRLPPTHTVWES